MTSTPSHPAVILGKDSLTMVRSSHIHHARTYYLMLFRRNLGTYKSQHFCQGGKIVELLFNLGTASPNTSPIIAMQNVRSSYHPDPECFPHASMIPTKNFQNNGVCFAEHWRGLSSNMALPFFRSHFAGGLPGMLRIWLFPPRYTYIPS
jgi:hypothetical protein